MARGRKPAAGKAPGKARKAAAGKVGKGGAKAAVKKTAGKAAARKAGREGAVKTVAKTSVAKKSLARKSAAGKPAAGATTKSLARRSPAKTSPAAKATAARSAAKPAATASKPARAARASGAPRAGGSAKTLAPKAAARTPVAPSAATRAAPTRRARPAREAVPGPLVLGPMGPRYAEILTPAALAFLVDLHHNFEAERRRLLARRAERQKRFDLGWTPDFLPETRRVREDDWKVAPIPRDLLDRRVEITGPVDRKMIVNALNSGAKVFMADFEDATSPTWSNMMDGQINLKDRWAGAIDFEDAASGKAYVLSDAPAVLMVRPRGLHMVESHLAIDGEPIAGAFFDFGLYVFHNSREQLKRRSTPAFYLPKLESHTEARLWNAVFSHAEEKLGIRHGTFKATVLIETLPAAFEMDEIIHELRDHMAGLNCGRWDYIFSTIKRLGRNPKYLTPDRAAMTMGKAFLGAYSDLLIKTCHRRGAFAMGGMAAQIPVKRDAAANAEALARVRADKEREAGAGHDGTWVAHPDLVPVAMEVFDRLMPGANQLDKTREEVDVSRADLLRIHEGERTEEGLRQNIRVGVQYLEAWLGGRGAVPLYDLMEDVATAEISRIQVWQWLRHRASLADGREVTPELFADLVADEMTKLRKTLGAARFNGGHFANAIRLFTDMSLDTHCEEFLTTPAYPLLG